MYRIILKLCFFIQNSVFILSKLLLLVLIENNKFALRILIFIKMKKVYILFNMYKINRLFYVVYN